jgi:hypothetical protein
MDFFILGVLGPPFSSPLIRTVLPEDDDEEDEAASDEIRTRRVAEGSIAITAVSGRWFFLSEVYMMD